MPTPLSLRAILASLIDYAGLYPPAALALPEVIENYRRYLSASENWMLNRLVLPAAKLREVTPGPDWKITLLADEPLDALPGSVESIETKTDLPFSRPVYREMPPEQINDGFAKIRTGSLVPEGIPSAESIAQFLVSAAAKKLAFKATAGLHHPFRCNRALTYAGDSPRAPMHGFLNVFAAASFTWHGAEQPVILDMLLDGDASAFEFTDAFLAWRGRRLMTEQIKTARREFAHSFGSCSFEEPIAELRELGWLQ